jgi:acyl-CoA-binding protein
VTPEQGVAVLLAAREWAFEHTTPQDFEQRFPEFVARLKLKPAMAEVASTYVLGQTASDEDQEIDRRGFELICSKKEEEAWSEADEQVWSAFMESCKKAAEQASASMVLAMKNLGKRRLPATRQEVDNTCALAHLREWARAQIN